MDDLLEFDESTGSLIKLATEMIAALLCAMASQSRSQPGERLDASALFWRVMAVVLLLVSANSLLHGEILLLSSMRDASKSYGVYEWRRFVQSVVVVAVITWLVYVQRWLRQLLHKVQERDLCEQALKGAFLVLLVLGMNVVSFHYIDSLIYMDIAGLSLANWLEGLGLGWVGLSALRTIYRSAQQGAQGV